MGCIYLTNRDVCMYISTNLLASYSSQQRESKTLSVPQPKGAQKSGSVFSF